MVAAGVQLHAVGQSVQSADHAELPRVQESVGSRDVPLEPSAVDAVAANIASPAANRPPAVRIDERPFMSLGSSFATPSQTSARRADASSVVTTYSGRILVARALGRSRRFGQEAALSPRGAGVSPSTSSEMKTALYVFLPPILMAIHRYGEMDRKVRKRWAPKVRAGKVNCARCGEPTLPSEKWDLDHDDDDPLPPLSRPRAPPLQPGGGHSLEGSSESLSPRGTRGSGDGGRFRTMPLCMESGGPP